MNRHRSHPHPDPGPNPETHRQPMFACYRIRLQLAWGAEKGAPLEASLEDHLRSCPACSARVNNRRRLETRLTADFSSSARGITPTQQHRAPSNLAARVRRELESESNSISNPATREQRNRPSAQPAGFGGWTGHGARTIVFATLGLLATTAFVRWELDRKRVHEQHTTVAATASGSSAHASTAAGNVDPLGWLHATMTQASLPLPQGADLLTMGSGFATPLEDEWRRVVTDATNTAVFLAKSWMPRLADSR